MQKLSQLSMQKLSWLSFCILQAIKNRSRGRPGNEAKQSPVANIDCLERGLRIGLEPRRERSKFTSGYIVGGVVFPADSGCGRGLPSKRAFVIREAKLSLLRASHCEYLIGPKPTWVQ